MDPAPTARALDVTLRPLPISGPWSEPVGDLPWHPDYPTAETYALLSRAAEAHRWSADGGSADWRVHQVVVDGLVVGDAGFAGPPGPGWPRTVEIGYAVVPASRGRGVATRACALLLDRAWAAGAEVVLARTEPENRASRRVLAANGFAARPDDTWVRTR